MRAPENEIDPPFVRHAREPTPSPPPPGNRNSGKTHRNPCQISITRVDINMGARTS
jgi:hypothetical protein